MHVPPNRSHFRAARRGTLYSDQQAGVVTRRAHVMCDSSFPDPAGNGQPPPRRAHKRPPAVHRQIYADVVKLADTAGSSPAGTRRGGSNPSVRTTGQGNGDPVPGVFIPSSFPFSKGGRANARPPTENQSDTRRAGGNVFEFMRRTTNYTYGDFINMTIQAFNVENKTRLDLNVKDVDDRNVADVMAWARRRGYEAERMDRHTLRITTTVRPA